MTLDDITIGLEQIKDYVIVSKEDAKKAVMLSNDISFLDTCMFAHHYSSSNVDIWVKQISKMCQTKTVFVITPLLLYEMQGGGKRNLSSSQVEYLKRLFDQGIKFVYISEEDCIRAIHQKYNESNREINKHICCVTKKISIRFPSVGENVRDRNNPMYKYVYGNNATSDKEDFLDELFDNLRTNKKPKDSLAEELIAILCIYLLEITDSETTFQMRLFSDDITAVVQLAASPLAEYAKRSKFKTVNSVGLIIAMDVHNNFASVNELAETLKKIRVNYKKIGIRDSGYDIFIHDSLGYMQVAEAIWENKIVIFPCVNPKDKIIVDELIEETSVS